MENQKQSILDKLANEYSNASNNLAAVKNALTRDVEAVRLKHIDNLKHAADSLALASKNLEAAIIKSPEIFIESKTQTLHGIKFGFRKATDELVYKIDEESIIDLIKEELPKKKKLLIKTEEKLVKSAIKNLTEDDLSKIECEIEKNDDVVFIKSADDIIDKFVKQLTAE